MWNAGRGKLLLYIFMIFAATSCLRPEYLKSTNADEGVKRISFVDQKGFPFVGLRFHLAFKENRTIAVAEAMTNSHGTYQLTKEQASNELVLCEDWWWWPIQEPGNDFISIVASHWSESNFNFEEVKRTPNEVKYRLQRVAFTDGLASTVIQRNTNRPCHFIHGCFNPSALKIAQSFYAPANLAVCVIGLGAFRGRNQPGQLGIYSDNNGTPGNEILTANADTHFRANTSSTTIADLCRNAHDGVPIQRGQVYWIVWTPNPASADTLINYNGSTLAPTTGLPMKETSDGATWTDVPLLYNGGLRSIGLHLSE